MVGQPSAGSLPGDKHGQQNLRGVNMHDYLKTVMSCSLNPAEGLSAAPMDVDYYNSMVDRDPECGASKIDKSASAVYVFYTHKGFHTEELFKAKFPFLETWDHIDRRLSSLRDSVKSLLLSEGYGDAKIEYFPLFYLDGAFSNAYRKSASSDIDFLKRVKRHYDPVKAGVSTGIFQHIEPSSSMKTQWIREPIKPICLHRTYGGWFQFAAIMFLTVPNHPYASMVTWDEFHSHFVSEKDANYYLLARALDDGVNDAWRDYPPRFAVDIRYDLPAYLWEKTSEYYEEADTPFVKAMRIANAFTKLLPPSTSGSTVEGQSQDSQSYPTKQKPKISETYASRNTFRSPTSYVVPDVTSTYFQSLDEGVDEVDGGGEEEDDEDCVMMEHNYTRNEVGQNHTSGAVPPPNTPTVNNEGSIIEKGIMEGLSFSLLG